MHIMQTHLFLLFIVIEFNYSTCGKQFTIITHILQPPELDYSQH